MFLVDVTPGSDLEERYEGRAETYEVEIEFDKGIMVAALNDDEILMWWSRQQCLCTRDTIPARAIKRIYALGGLGRDRRGIYSVPQEWQGNDLDWSIWCEPCGIQWPVNTWYCTWCHNLLDQRNEWLNNRLLGAEFGSRPNKQAGMRWKWGM